MTIQKAYPFKTHSKIYDNHTQIQAHSPRPAVQAESPMMDEEFRQYLQYRSLEYRRQSPARTEALEDLDGMMGDLSDYGDDFFPEESHSVGRDLPTEEKIPAETTKEPKAALRKELDQAKEEIQKAGLEPEAEKTLVDRVTELNTQIADKNNPADPEEIRSELSGIRDDLKTAVDEKKVADAEKAKEREEFESEVKAAKREFKKKIESENNLTPASKEALVADYNNKADALLNETDFEKAREELSQLETDLETDLEDAVNGAKADSKKTRDGLYNELIKFPEANRFREQKGHWWQKGVELGEKFLSAIQTGNWGDFKTFLSKLEGNQRWVCVMRVISAVYRIAGKDEGKAIQMLNNFVPKDVIQSMRDSVMSEPQNIDWGNGDKNECGPEGCVEWNITGTADFLSRSLAARKDVDPYEANKAA